MSYVLILHINGIEFTGCNYREEREAIRQAAAIKRTLQPIYGNGVSICVRHQEAVEC